MSRIGHKTLYVLLIISFLFVFSLTTIYGEENINIFIDDKPITFDVNPVIINGRTLVPFRAIFESINANVCWDNETRTAVGTKNNILIKLPIGKNYALVNENKIVLDVPATIINNRTMVPLRFVSENMGFDVVWDGATKTIKLTDTPTQPVLVETYNTNNIEEFTFNNIYVGSTVQDLKNQYGEPNRIDDSLFNIEWYVYNSDYDHYIQFGIKNNKVVALYTNNGTWKSKRGLGYESSISKANEILGNENKELTISNTRFSYEDVSKYNYKNLNVWTFWDKYNDDKLNAIFIVDYAVECQLKDIFSNKSTSFKKAMEKQSLDLVNSARAKHDLNKLTWGDKASKSAYLHSLDMATKDYFAHNNLEGLSPFDRMKNKGLIFKSASENISAGMPTSFFTHANWMNSEGHRSNILGNFTNLGVGVELSGFYGIYWTQNFYTPK